jgi:hypothetical protein
LNGLVRIGKDRWGAGGLFAFFRGIKKCGGIEEKGLTSIKYHDNINYVKW